MLEVVGRRQVTLDPRRRVSVEDVGGEQAGILTHIPPINFLFSLFLCLRVVPTFGIHNTQFLCTN